MTTNVHRWMRIVLFVGLFQFGAVKDADAIEVVCSRDVQIDRLSLRELQAIFTMRLRVWPNGKPIKVFVLNDHEPAQVEFSKRVLDIFPYVLRRYWDRLVFSGTGQAPFELKSMAEMYERVASTEGAIGFLSSDLIDRQVQVVGVAER